MNNFTGCKDLLTQLDTLKNLARDFSAREEQLNATFRVQSAKERDAFNSQEQEQTAETSVRMANEMDDFAKAKEELQSRFERRQARINRAYNRIRERMQAEVSAQDDDCKRQAQQDLIAAERRRDEELIQADVAAENFQQRLAEAAAAFQRLEKSVRRAFGGYGRFRRRLNASSSPDFAGGGNESLDELQRVSDKLNGDLARFKKFPLPKIFRFIPIWLVSALLLGIALAVPALRYFGNPTLTPLHAGIALAALAIVLVVYLIGLRAAAPLAKIIAGDFVRARNLLQTGSEKTATEHQFELERIEQEFQQRKNEINQEWKRASKEIGRRRYSQPTDLDDRDARLKEKNEYFRHSQLQRLQATHEEKMSRLREEADEQARQLSESHKSKLAKLENDFQSGWQTLVAEWQNQMLPLWTAIQSADATAEKFFPDWLAADWNSWTPPQNFLNAVKFARLEINTSTFIPNPPKDERLTLPLPPTFSLPLLLTHPRQGSLLFETGKTGGDEAVGTINNIILRLLATTPPGRLEFTIFDPVGLGQNFAALMHLADYEANTINSRIWTQTAQFEEKLADLNEHMEKIIQMYLRNEYATITEYNAQAGSVAEKYHFLVVASFPANFNETAAKRLRNIAANGARCGVFTLIQWDQRNALPQDFVPDELRKNSVALMRAENGFEFSGGRIAGIKIALDAPPPTEFTTQLLHRIGDAGKNSNRVEVPFEQIAPENFWQDETTEELRVPIGRSGATKLQYLALGRDTRQHALIAGKTGSGKSTLFHIIITNLALRCSPEQVEFYLVDFKKGVEFKCYGAHRLPHAKVVAIESDRAFGLSVLQRVDDELRRRGDLFRKVGAQNLASYKSAVAATPPSPKSGAGEGDEGVATTPTMPRVLLMIDEFQEFFTEEDRISQGAAVLLDRIVRQGRAFGIHVLLGSQTLGGAYTLARATIGQMVIRIALQCNEADAYLIMDQDNPAPRLLSRPGEGIYNDAAGAIEGNSPFQAVWLSDKTRDFYLAKIRERADKNGNQFPGPIVFEGNAPADVRENHLLRELISGSGWKPDQTGKMPVPQANVWLGAPNSIKGPTEAIFKRQSGSNLLVVAQSEERTLTILSIALVSLAAQFPKSAAKFFAFDSTPPGFPQREFLQRVIQSIPHETIQASNSNLAEVMANLANELKRRAENEVGQASSLSENDRQDACPTEIFILIHGLQNFKKLKQEDEFSFSSSSGDALNPAAIFTSLITEGPARGIHVIATGDTYNNVNRFIGRKTLSEFEMRVVFQMSASDSASLIDAPDASALGLHRALFYNDREGSLETFRPYALPDNNWLEEVAKQLSTK